MGGLTCLQKGSLGLSLDNAVLRVPGGWRREEVHPLLAAAGCPGWGACSARAMALLPSAEGRTRGCGGCRAFHWALPIWVSAEILGCPVQAGRLSWSPPTASIYIYVCGKQWETVLSDSFHPFFCLF